MKIVRATGADADHIVRMTYETMRALASGYQRTVNEWEAAQAPVRRRFLERVDADDALFLIVRPTDGDPIAMLEASVRTTIPLWVRRKRLHLSVLFVDPDHRRNGLGRQLMEQALDWGRDLGCDLVDLGTATGTAAQALYRSMGFVTTRERMERRL